MQKKWLLLLLLFLGAPLYYFETLKYKDKLYHCYDRYLANEELLRSEICSNPQRRLRFQTVGTVDCKQAERENANYSPHQCAFRAWWPEFEPVALYSRVAGTYWSVLGFVLPIVFIAMYFISSQISQRWVYKRQEQFAERMITEYSNTAAQSHYPLDIRRRSVPLIKAEKGEHNSPLMSLSD